MHTLHAYTTYILHGRTVGRRVTVGRTDERLDGVGRTVGRTLGQSDGRSGRQKAHDDRLINKVYLQKRVGIDWYPHGLMDPESENNINSGP